MQRYLRRYTRLLITLLGFWDRKTGGVSGMLGGGNKHCQGPSLPVHGSPTLLRGPPDILCFVLFSEVLCFCRNPVAVVVSQLL